MGIMVLGAGRSGTSAVAAALAAVGHGFQLPSDDFEPSPADNPRGYAESRSLSGFNNRLLDHLGGAWHVPPRLEPGWVGRLFETPGFSRADAVDVFHAVFRTGAWVWKDPRTCLIAPYWFEVLADVDAICIAFRHPVEVAGSMARIQWPLTSAHSMALWERCNRLSIEAAARSPVLITDYASLLHDRDSWLKAAEALFAHIGARLVSDAPEAVDRAVDAGLRRQKATSRGLTSDVRLSANAIKLLDHLREIEGFHPCLDNVELAQETPGIDDLLRTARQR